MAGSELEGLSILIVEDELLVAMDRRLLLTTCWGQMTVHRSTHGLMNGRCRS